ncbi:cysteine--tRNA ligase [Vampirovibrio chlorellavorus]|uniref:cysteine--tRNA ligase n=1 Tax=Vampirovibrio chlorellavorus TaxID=758823 RepID=UPI0026E94CF7|nr:cysteine--tRNA ligase [Vampirovibrio chlorellavorus]
MAQSTSENQPPELKLFNTLTGQLEPFAPLDPAGKQVKLYVCGPTVYDDAHLGHARCYITWDVLYRFLKFLGYDVKYVRNVTDVDDKILNRAKERGETPAALAERNYESFAADMKALNVLPPDEEPRATQYIGDMLQGIQALMDKGAAYRTVDGSVYFRVSTKADYGKLKFGTHDPEALKKHLEDLKSGARVDVDDEKESPLDFALWKAVPLSDPHGWESPWPGDGTDKGWGRPGWHMECSAMNHAVFGAQIDIHAGGADLIFPHHENEIAQSEAWTGCTPFAQYWLHNGFVNVSGEKMSKSLGNFSTIKKLLERYDANTIRYFLLTNHYRMPVDFNDEALQAAENWVKDRHKALKMICDAFNMDAFHLRSWCIENYSPDVSVQYKNMYALCLAMAEDSNTPRALSFLNASLAELRDAFREGRSEAVKIKLKECVSIFTLLGFNLNLIFQKKSLPLDEINTIYREMTGKWLEPDAEPEVMFTEIIEMRKQAKVTKNWTQADAIRKHFTDIGLQILDNKDGTTTVEKDGVEILRV